MAKFNSSRSKSARNPGPVGRAKTFRAKSNPGGKGKASSGTGGRRSASSPNGRPGRAASRKGRFSDEGFSEDTEMRNRRKGSNSMNFSEADDYVRPAAQPAKRRGSSGSFNPLNLLRADEEDGVVNLSSLEYVEMDDRDFDRLASRKNRRGGRNSERDSRFDHEDGEALFSGLSQRNRAASGKFMKDFRDAGSSEKPARKRSGEASRTVRASAEFGKSAARSAKAFKTTGLKSVSAAKSADSKGLDLKNKGKGKKNASKRISTQEGERLQKVLATAGFGSRRDCEEFIITGRVMVDRQIVTELGTRVRPDQTIHLDGELVRRPKKFVYYALNKPGNVICSNDDPDGRRRALDFIHENVPGLFPVGRLDLHSEGLLLITNDGELANRLTHPSYEVPKVYRVRVSGAPTRETIAQICRGVHLAEGLAKAEEVRLKHSYRDGTSVLEITLREGRNREIRRILARVGHNVLDLARISIGNVKLGKVPLGAYRPLTAIEVKSLKRLVGLTDSKPKDQAAEKSGKGQKTAKSSAEETVSSKSKRTKVQEMENDSWMNEKFSAMETSSRSSAENLYAEWKAEMNSSENLPEEENFTVSETQTNLEAKVTSETKAETEATLEPGTAETTAETETIAEAETEA